ncbi:MAG TPA: hypothetical protein VMS35_00315 [Nitrososphaeraceae archaeon]|jgi:hypothetical protein|nr:hypothetical protein [Nitrososphaeraceae archaeon]
MSLFDPKNFDLFKQDLIYVWNMLIDKYIKEEENNIKYMQSNKFQNYTL